MTATAKVWTKETVASTLATSAVFVERSLVKLLARQTSAEQACGQTIEHNGRGFTGLDAELLTSFASQVQRNRYGRPEGQRLSVKQMALARRKLPKYWRQLLEEAAANGCTVSMKVPRAKRAPAPAAPDDAQFDAMIAARDREDARAAAEAKAAREALENAVTPREAVVLHVTHLCG